MTSIEATDLAVRILQTFNGPPAQDWEETLLELDAGRAGTAYARLRREHDSRWLSIARYLDTYRALHVDDASTRPKPCNACDNTGWVSAPRFAERGQVYAGVEPCTCPEGRARAGSHAWTGATPRELLTDREADRLIAALKENPQ